ncbi:MAG: ABC transporter substrate-binding protein [Gemmatimonadota bacterium]|nr:ABC transporter substrate-binding protein [Gemmatimonadota bacterium]
MSSFSLFHIAVAGVLVASQGCSDSSRHRMEGTGEELFPVEVAVRPFLTNAPIYIALEEGFFVDEGLDVRVSGLSQSSSQSLPLLARGRIDVLASAVNVGLFNAIARGAPVRIVAARGSVRESGCGHTAVVVRRGLAPAPSGSPVSTLVGRRVGLRESHSGVSRLFFDSLLSSAGTGSQDVELVPLPIPARLQAMGRGSIDATVLAEPWLTRMVDAGHRVLIPAREIVPGMSNGLLLMGPSLLEENPKVGRRFVGAYLRGVRQYNRGKTARNLEILSEATGLEPSLLKRICWPAIRGSGVPDIDGLEVYQRWAHDRGHLDRLVEPRAFWEPSLVEHTTSSEPRSARRR